MDNIRTLHGDVIAQHGRGRVDQTALHAGGCGDKLALARPAPAIRLCDAEGDQFEGLAGKAAGKVVAPGAFGQVKPAVAGLQRVHRNAPFSQPRHPGPVRTQPRPARPAQRQHGGARPHRLRAGGGLEAQGAVIAPARPAPAHVEAHALLAQAVHPGAQ